MPRGPKGGKPLAERLRLGARLSGMGPVTLSPMAAAKLSISGQSPAASQSWGLFYQPVPKAVPSPCLIWPRVIKMRRPVLRQELRQRVEKTSAV